MYGSYQGLKLKKKKLSCDFFLRICCQRETVLFNKEQYENKTEDEKKTDEKKTGAGVLSRCPKNQSEWS